MADSEKRAHDLAMIVVSKIIDNDFDTMRNSGTDGDEAREVFAASVLDEYDFFFNAFKKSMQ